MRQNERWQPVQDWLRHNKLWFEYGGLAILIMLPLLLPGYILAFDMGWGPVKPAVDPSSNTWLLQTLLGAIESVVPGWIIQKLVLLAIFTLGGVGAHRLAKYVKAGKRIPATAYAVGFLYICNPFVYTRFVTGQWLVLAGWALLPWAIAACWRLAKGPDLYRAAIAGAWLAAIGLTSIHAAGMMMLVVPVLLTAAGLHNWQARLMWGGAAAGIAAIINMRWLLPAISGNSALGERVAGFGGDQLTAFASTGSILGNVPLSTFLLQGFWADGQNRYALPSQGGWPWGLAVVLLFGVIVLGIVRIYKTRDRLGAALLSLGIVAWLLAMGSGWNLTAPLAEWLHANVPFYAGFREPHKWLMVLALAFAYAFAHGIASLYPVLSGKAMRSLRRPAVVLSLLIPFVFAGIMLFGAGNQLRAARYPEGWARTAGIVNERSPESPLVVLPWHMYLPVSFAGRTVANPAPHYFKGPVVIGNDPELRGLKPDTTDDTATRAADFALLRDRRALTGLREEDSVEYILLVKEVDWRRYGWLDRVEGLRRVQDTATTRLYKLERPDAR